MHEYIEVFNNMHFVLLNIQINRLIEGKKYS